MKKHLFRLLSCWMALLLILAAAPCVRAAEIPVSLSGKIQNAKKRHFAEAMISFHLRENETVRNTLEQGHPRSARGQASPPHAPASRGSGGPFP